jgi:hypothetical protein
MKLMNIKNHIVCACRGVPLCPPTCTASHPSDTAVCPYRAHPPQLPGLYFLFHLVKTVVSEVRKTPSFQQQKRGQLLDWGKAHCYFLLEVVMCSDPQ